MQIRAYQRSVDKNIVSGSVKTVGDINSYGGNGSGYGQLADSIKALGAMYIKKEEDDMAVKVMQANTEYGKQVSALNVELSQNKLSDAEGVQEEYIKREQEIRKNISGQYNFKYEKAQFAFDNMAEKNTVENSTKFALYEQQEKENNKLFIDSERKQIRADEVLAMDFEGFANVEQTILVDQLALYGEGKKDYIAVKMREELTNLTQLYVYQNLDNENFGNARKSLDLMRGKIDVNTYAKLETTVKQFEKSKNIDNQVSVGYEKNRENVEQAAKDFVEQSKKQPEQLLDESSVSDFTNAYGVHVQQEKQKQMIKELQTNISVMDNVQQLKAQGQYGSFMLDRIIGKTDLDDDGKKRLKDIASKSLTSGLKYSDVNTIGDLKRKQFAGSLQQADLDKCFSKNLLTVNDYYKFTSNLCAELQETGDSASNNADKNWFDEIESGFSDKGLKDKKIASILTRLDEENVAGWERYDKAIGWLKSDSDFISSKASSVGDSVFKLLGSRADSVESLTKRAFNGKKTSEKGLEIVSGYLSGITQRAKQKGDPTVEQALDWFIENEQPITIDGFNKVRAKFTNRRLLE